MALETELQTYNAKLSELRDHEGKFVLIQKERVVDFFNTYEDAIKAGYQAFQLRPFLVKQVFTMEPVFFVTRDIVPQSAASTT